MVEEDNGGEIQPPNVTKRQRCSRDPLEGLNDIEGTPRYQHWTKEELEEESKRRRLPVKGGVEGMTRRLIKEDNTQPKLHFRAQGSVKDTNTEEFAQGGDMREEGGGGNEGGSVLELSKQ